MNAQLALDPAVMVGPKKFAKYLDLAKWSRRQARWWLQQYRNHHQLWGSDYCMEMFHNHMRSARLAVKLARGFYK